MTRNGRRKPRASLPSFNSLSTAMLLEIVNDMDGDAYSIYTRQFLSEKNVPNDLIESVTRTIHSDMSDTSGKAVISDNRTGQPVESMTGIESMGLYYRLCMDLGVSSDSPYMGRGKTARLLHSRLKEHLATRPDPVNTAGVTE